jgi:hypothetical protein
VDICAGDPMPMPRTDIPDATAEATLATRPAVRSPALTDSRQCSKKLNDRGIRVFVTKGCFALSESTFQNGKPPDGEDNAIFEEKGGAVRVSEEANYIEITNTLFWKCWVIYGSPHDQNPGWGGAIYVTVPQVVIARVCGKECSGRDGHFLYLDRNTGQASGQLDLNLSTLHLCAAGVTNRQTTSQNGGICISNKVGLLGNYINCSVGTTKDQGASFYFEGSDGDFSLSYLTIAKCTAATILYSARLDSGKRELAMCNFVDNSGSKAIVYVSSIGFPISDSLFRNNLGGSAIQIDRLVRFPLENCFIDSDLPSAAY